ncbi:hypothetical protein GCM10023201_20310 [Actinomycetospora corticicola]|uniref:SAM-dependent methyltransferase n=1 Tax=Actinomycetospora corticicola TaxID=663602 RepID=A0A7Y9J3P2_9PSEU|nr:hypothetical protein [Actinomycetospora corticicola]NYD34253.1 hypothetical protein [Actinomycetospora corticicola]
MTAMEGGGRYNAHASAQAASAEFALDLVREAARTAPVGPDGTVTVVDYGASEGRNSLAPVNAAVETLRAVHGEEQPIWVVHTDLPDNDFSSLFHVVADDSRSYRRPGVHTAAVGRSFYEQLLPIGSVGLGWSSIAVHWLRDVPGPLDGFWPGNATGEQAATWERAAAADWSAFLTARSAELRPGARLVVVSGAAYDDEPPRRSGAERVMDEVARGLAALVEREVLTVAERDAMVVPAWYRTEVEWRAPFTGDLGLELERYESVELGDPLWQQHGDGADYGRAAAAAIRVSFGQPLLQGLEPSRREAVAAALFDEHLANAIAAGPPGPWFDWRLAIMCFAREH